MPETVINDDCLAGLAGLPEGSVHCVVTSPPYWGLRDYQTHGQIGLERTLEEFVAIEINPEYADMARRRIANPEPEPEIPDIEGQLTMEFAGNAH